MIPKICAYRYCEKEFDPPKNKYCSPICCSREGCLIKSEKGKLKLSTIPQEKRAVIDVNSVNSYPIRNTNISERWALIGSNSSMEEMQEVNDMFNQLKPRG